MFVLISYPLKQSQKRNGIKWTAKKEKIMSDFCDKHPAIQIITLLGEINNILEPPTGTGRSHSIQAVLKLIAKLHLAFNSNINGRHGWNMYTYPVLDMLLVAAKTWISSHAVKIFNETHVLSAVVKFHLLINTLLGEIKDVLEPPTRRSILSRK